MYWILVIHYTLHHREFWLLILFPKSVGLKELHRVFSLNRITSSLPSRLILCWLCPSPAIVSQIGWQGGTQTQTQRVLAA